MNVLKKVTNKIENSKIIKNPKFLVIGLIIIIAIMSLIYFIFLKYSPIMNFKYEGYAISGKEITENLLGSSSDETNNTNADKNLELAKIEEQGTIFKKLNDYFVGNKEKTEINLNYPIYINGNSSLYNLSEDTTLISKNFEEVSGYPNLSISEGKIYDGNNLERADGKEYIFVKTNEGIYINLVEIKIRTTANEYTIPLNSIVAFTENTIRYYSVKDNILVFNEINDIDNNSKVEIVENNYTYEELLTILGILSDENNAESEQGEQSNIIQEDSTYENNSNNEDNDKKTTDENTTIIETEESQASYVKPKVTTEDFTAEVYTAKSVLDIKDPTGRIIEAPTFEIYKDGKMYLRRIFSNSGEIQITGLVPETEYEVIGKFIYLNENNQKVENTFYEGKFTTKGYDELGSIDIQKENGEVFSKKIQITKVKITSDLNTEVIKGIKQVEIETGEIRTVLNNSQINELLQGKEITIESSEGLKSNSKIKYAIRFYDKNGIELKVNNNEGETRTSQEAPTARVSIKEQDIVSVTLKLNLTNRDNVKLEKYKYIVTKPNGDIVKEERLAENEKEILLEDLDQNQYYKIVIYADYDLNDNRGKQENKELGNLVFATQPISTLGSLELNVENKELTSTTSTISYKIDEDRTDKRLIQILNELKINIIEQSENNNNNQEQKEGKVIYTDILSEDEIKNLQQGVAKEIKYENLKSNTKYMIEITGNVQLGNTKENIPITYNYKEFTTLKIPAKVEIRNQFVTGNLIDFDVRIADINNSVLNNTVRMELRDENDNLIDLQELKTNQDYLRKTYERLDENRTYRLKFIADQYNEGNTDATYQANYLIKELEIVTEPGISGSIGLTELARKATGKNLVDMSSETKWYVYPNFNTSNYYGKEYNEETKILKLGGNSNHRRAVYDLREYAGQEVTMSFKAKAISGTQNAYIQNSKTDTNISKIDGLTTEWQDFQYTLTLDSTGYLGFYIVAGNGIEVKELQVELGNRKTSYEEFKYILRSNYSINLEDKRDEITTNDYYIKIYEDNNLVKTDRYEEILEENIITNTIKTYETQAGKQYKVELVVKVKEREYVLSEIEYNTQDTEEIKGIYSKEDFLEIQPRGHYIVLGDIDLSGGTGTQYRFGNGNMYFEGTINFNGHILTRDSKMTEPIINYLGEKGKLENVVFHIKLNNEIEIKGFYGLIYRNYGTIENIQINLIESTRVPNEKICLLGYENYGIINKFIIDYKVPMYGGRWLIGLISYNRENGIISNGYVKGENIKAIFKNTQQGVRAVANITVQCSSNAIVRNIYTLNGIDTEGSEGGNGYSGHIGSEFYGSSKLENVYSVGLGDTYTNNGPNIFSWASSQKIQNSYYFNDQIFSSSYNRKSTPLALWDATFQNQVLNTDNAFYVDELVKKGYYPQLNMPECMPAQEYIELPEVEDKDLPDILSMEVLESTKDTAKVKFSLNNPSAETITNIKIQNLQCTIESQEYNEGKSEVIAILNNPVICVSEYSVMSISTKGAYNQEYTREFEENERLIDVDFYKEINSTDDWKNINKSPTENYILMQDLDFKNNSRDSYISVNYDGILDGGNHTIRNVNLEGLNGIIVYSKNIIKNLKFENITLEASDVKSIIVNANKIENVYANNVKLIKTEDVSNNRQGGLVGTLSNEMKNCGINNVTIINETYSTSTRIGGLIAETSNANINNCYATNINIQTKNNTYTGIGGLIGQVGSSTITNCYTTGKIKIDGSNVGGLVGYMSSSSKLYNSFAYVNITGNATEIGGIVGNFSSGCQMSNNLALGNLYTSKLNEKGNRIAGIGTLTDTNYAYANQRLNGLIETIAGTSTELLTTEELLTQETYTDKLQYGNAYDYKKLKENILPKLCKVNNDGTYSNELLPKQEDIYIDISNEFKIDNVVIQKSAVDEISGQIVIINTNEAEVTGIEIEGMDTTVTNIITRDRKSYINITAKPNKFYDTYKITKVNYKENGVQKEQEVEGKIEIQFYKDLYNFEDWQEIEAGTYQNYRLMEDIDFAGRKNINTDVTMARLEAVGGVKTIKNIELTFRGKENGIIKDITTKLSDVRFENIKINFESSTSNVGIIGTESGNMDNTEFSEITIVAENSTKVGIVGYSSAVMNNIKMEKINVDGNYQVGGLVGEGIGEILNTNADNINVTGNYERTGGIVGNANSKLESITLSDSNIEGQDYVGGIVGYQLGATNKVSSKLFVDNSNIIGNSNVGGIHGYIASYAGGYRYIYNSTITGEGDNIGGIVGNNSGGASTRIVRVVNCEIKGVGANSSSVGGISGLSHAYVQNAYVQDSKVISNGSYVGGFVGKNDGYIITIDKNYITNVEIEGYNNVGGIIGDIKTTITLSSNYISGSITAINSNIGGLIGSLDNSNMTAVSNISNILDNYVADTVINGNKNVGGLIGEIQKELYMPEDFYYSNYIEADINGQEAISLGIGNMPNQNQYLKNTYYYKYSSVNGKNPNEQNEIFIPQSAYLTESDLIEKTTYTSKLKWPETYWDFEVLKDNKYPILSNSIFTEQEGIDIPRDVEHIIENTTDIEKQKDVLQEQIEESFEYLDKTIETYSTYSVIAAEDGSKVTRNTKLYVKDNNLYAIPVVLESTPENENITPVADNLILDSYNGKEYETVLGSDGKLYDLKEPIKYPENFVNEEIESIGNNLNSNSHEVEVVYKNGDKVKFNYQTGEIISSSEDKSSEQEGILDYIKKKISKIGDSYNITDDITNKYEESKELQSKLEETSVEEAIEKQNGSNSEQAENIGTATENNETNNSYKENKYISIYNEETGEYEIFNEEELLDTNKEEVVSENEKIEANNLNEYYASGVETKNTKMGIVWIVVSIIGVGIILFVLKKNLKKKA